MIVIVNGAPAEIADGAGIAAVLEHLGARDTGKGVAVAVNGEVVRRAEWHTTTLAERDRIEVVTAVQGG